MSISESLLPEFDHEMANTRKVLERIPDDKLDWKAHEKSNTIGWVGMHLAEIPGWIDFTLNKDSFDVAPQAANRTGHPRPRRARQYLTCSTKTSPPDVRHWPRPRTSNSSSLGRY